MPATDAGRKARRTPVYALVTLCKRMDGSKGDLWSGRHTVIVALTCGHTIRKIVLRRFLVGEKIRCPKCTDALRQPPALPGFYPGASV